MSNVTITASYQTVSLIFNQLSSVSGVSHSKWQKTSLVSVFQLINGAVVIRTIYKQDFVFCASSEIVQNALLVDSVLGIEPTNNNHLFELISSIID